MGDPLETTSAPRRRRGWLWLALAAVALPFVFVVVSVVRLGLAGSAASARIARICAAATPPLSSRAFVDLAAAEGCTETPSGTCVVRRSPRLDADGQPDGELIRVTDGVLTTTHDCDAVFTRDGLLEAAVASRQD